MIDRDFAIKRYDDYIIIEIEGRYWTVNMFSPSYWRIHNIIIRYMYYEEPGEYTSYYLEVPV